jgi:hypothetical protein
MIEVQLRGDGADQLLIDHAMSAPVPTAAPLDRIPSAVRSTHPDPAVSLRVLDELLPRRRAVLVAEDESRAGRRDASPAAALATGKTAGVA